MLNYLRSVIEVSEEMYVAARELDRYPNAFESSYPGMYYDGPTAEKLSDAQR